MPYDSVYSEKRTPGALRTVSGGYQFTQNVYTIVYIFSRSVHIANRYKTEKSSWQKERQNRGHFRRSRLECQIVYIRQYNIPSFQAKHSRQF